MNIRPKKEDDDLAIKEIYSLYWTDKYFLKHTLERLKDSLDPLAPKISYFVAEEDSVVVGVIGFRGAPLHMQFFSKTSNPAELYILAVKNQKFGVGKNLIKKIISETKKLGYTEIVLFSSVSFKNSWSFYDHMGFERVESAIAPNEEQGQTWRVEL